MKKFKWRDYSVEDKIVDFVVLNLNKCEEFLKVPYLLDFRIIDNKIYLAYEENFTKGDINGKFDNSKRFFYSYVIDCVSLDDSSVRENLLRLNYAYKDFYEAASSEFLSHLPTEKVEIQDSLNFEDRCLGGTLYRGKNTYLYGIHKGKLYFRYNDKKEESVDDKILEINSAHAIFDKIKALYETDKEKIKEYGEVLLDLAKLIEGLQPENPTEFSDKLCSLLA